MQVVKFVLMFVACAAAGIALVAIADLLWSFFGWWLAVPVAALFASVRNHESSIWDINDDLHGNP